MNNEINKELNKTKEILEKINRDVALEYAKWTKDKAKIKF